VAFALFMPERKRQPMTPPATMAPIWPLAEGNVRRQELPRPRASPVPDQDRGFAHPPNGLCDDGDGDDLESVRKRHAISPETADAEAKAMSASAEGMVNPSHAANPPSNRRAACRE